MFSRCRKYLLSVLLLAAALPAHTAGRVLRVCAEPNNLPFSNERREGFENRLAEMMANDLGARLEYTWWAARRGFVRNSLAAGRCDVIMGVPSTLGDVAATRPYYRSTYVLVSRGARISSLLDPRLEKLRIGVQVVGEDYAPPAHILGQRGLARNVVGYSLVGPYGEANPAARIVDAVARGEVDVAIVWGPFAGYFAKRESVPLQIAAVTPAVYQSVPFTYGISMAVRKDDLGLREELNRAIEKERAAIHALLTEFGVPLVEAEGGEQACVSLPRPASRFWR
ncbi:MAG: substrate-binding domain-containing protein [Acidobacteriia bacterium]|nr:substrate-binding domain-containing protein [Terriglobia bacterium]